MADKVKLGIIGYGHIGSQHGRAIRDGKCPQVNLTAVCDIDPARLELAKKTNGEDIQTFTDASELIHSGACEAVIIAVPHYLHPSMAIEAMETGLHVIVEKPAGVYTKQVEEMNAVAAKHPELVYTKLAAGERFPVSGEEAIVSTRLLHAVYSSAKNHEVIRLDTKENQA